MRPLMNVLSKIATAIAIADSAIESVEEPEARTLYGRMSETAYMAIRAFPGNLNPKEVSLISSRLDMFFDRMNWDSKPKSSQTLMIFNTQQLEEIRHALVQHKADKTRINAIDDLIKSETDIYEHFVKKSGREFHLCNISGMRAADVWDEIWRDTI